MEPTKKVKLIIPQDIEIFIKENGKLHLIQVNTQETILELKIKYFLQQQCVNQDPLIQILQEIGLSDHLQTLYKEKVTLRMLIDGFCQTEDLNEVLIQLGFTNVFKRGKFIAQIMLMKKNKFQNQIHVIDNEDQQCYFDQQEQYIFEYKRNQLENQKTIADYNIQNFSQIETIKIEQSDKFQIFVKGLQGQTIPFSINKYYSTDDLKIQISFRTGIAIDQQRLIFGGGQLSDGTLLSKSRVGRECTIHLILRLRGEIGEYSDHNDSIGIQYLQSNFQSIKLRPQQINDLISVSKQIQNSRGIPQQYDNPSVYSEEETQMNIKCRSELIQIIESQYDNKSEDFKHYLSYDEIRSVIGDVYDRLVSLFQGQVDQIVLRRVQGNGNCIKFHTDYNQKTMQVILNNENEYEGGRVVFLLKSGELKCFERPVGSATVHNFTVVHGVTKMTQGVRFSLFLLQNEQNP